MQSSPYSAAFCGVEEMSECKAVSLRSIVYPCVIVWKFRSLEILKRPLLQNLRNGQIIPSLSLLHLSKAHFQRVRLNQDYFTYCIHWNSQWSMRQCAFEWRLPAHVDWHNAGVDCCFEFWPHSMVLENMRVYWGQRPQSVSISDDFRIPTVIFKKSLQPFFKGYSWDSMLYDIEKMCLVIGRKPAGNFLKKREMWQSYLLYM